jgi:hypothetical protein
VAKKIITDTIHTTMIPKKKRRMMYLFISLYSVWVFPFSPGLFSNPEDLGEKTLTAECAHHAERGYAAPKSV